MKNLNYIKALLCIVLSFIGVLIIDIAINTLLLRQNWIESEKIWLPLETMNRLVPIAWIFFSNHQNQRVYLHKIHKAHSKFRNYFMLVNGLGL